MDQATKLVTGFIKAFSPPPVDLLGEERTTCNTECNTSANPANGRTIQQHLELSNLRPALHLSVSGPA